MNESLVAFLVSLAAVTLAEMGDKTQLLAMAFATRFKPLKVMAGVFLATVLNHALAVAAGNLITRVHYLDVWIQGIASVSFVLFGLWTIRGDSLEGEENMKTRFGAVATVAIAFFIAELGDKTQLATIALATRYPLSPVYILIGTTTGMLVADGVGILVGVVLCRRLPERTIKLVSAAGFVLFGLAGSFRTAVDSLNFSYPAAFAAVIFMGAVTVAAAYRIIKNSADRENVTVVEYCKLRGKLQSPENE